MFTKSVDFDKNNANTITQRRKNMKKSLTVLCAALFIQTVAFADSTPSSILNTTATAKEISYDCQSLAWNLAAANKGDVEAQYQVGMKYFNGEEVQADQKLAQQWLKIAAEHNHAQAQYRLATIAELGLMGAKNETEAFQWYLKAANQGDAKAQFKVAQAYQSGTGIAQDQLQAQQWLQKAAQAKHPLAQATLAKL